MDPTGKNKVSGLIITAFFWLISGLLLHGCGGNTLTPEKGFVEIPLTKINDGKAHYFKVRADGGIMVTFFVLKTADGVFRAAIDSCDVCYESGKGYVQEGDYMVCVNCGQKFASDKINVIKGGCNPAPLAREIVGDNLLISMQTINSNSWYCRFKS
ncbi:MAG: DUF2318 domain-containing protein [Proteobacteria bacterium]|nr:DUF2318 domain-containing protein [Pseudomonadota bacterium]MBU1711381.1 DUF2318 domain-containing protein [Pseudomonadota bacterium]